MPLTYKLPLYAALAMYLWRYVSVEEIRKIDKKITPISEKLKELAKEMKFKRVCELTDQDKISNLKFKGLYLIEVETNGGTYEAWVEQFVKRWDLSELKDQFTCTSKNKRIIKHTKLKKWMPIYLGKSANVASRVLTHLNSPIERKTFALKINSRINMKNEKFKLSVIELDVENYSFIAPALESALREIINPIIGKQ